MASMLKENRWLRNPVTREKSMRMAAASSSAVEGICKPFAAVANRKPGKTVTSAPHTRAKSARSQ
jgi:hypothetical protein